MLEIIMKYVKLTAKPDTWFKAGTEVYHYDCNPPNDIYRVTLEEWNKHLDEAYSWHCINVRGIIVISRDFMADNYGLKIGDECWDGELCPMDEFEVEIVDQPR